MTLYAVWNINKHDMNIMPVLTIEPAKFSPDAALIYPKIFSFVNSFMVFDRLIICSIIAITQNQMILLQMIKY